MIKFIFLHFQNCPHGRPTMRHLINTAMLMNADDDDEENVNKTEINSPT